MLQLRCTHKSSCRHLPILSVLSIPCTWPPLYRYHRLPPEDHDVLPPPSLPPHLYTLPQRSMADQPSQDVPSSLLHSEGPTTVSLQLELAWPLDSCSHLTSPLLLPSGTHHGPGQAQVVGGHHLPAGSLGHNGHLGDTFLLASLSSLPHLDFLEYVSHVLPSSLPPAWR